MDLLNQIIALPWPLKIARVNQVPQTATSARNSSASYLRNHNSVSHSRPLLLYRNAAIELFKRKTMQLHGRNEIDIPTQIYRSSWKQGNKIGHGGSEMWPSIQRTLKDLPTDSSSISTRRRGKQLRQRAIARRCERFLEFSDLHREENGEEGTEGVSHGGRGVYRPGKGSSPAWDGWGWTWISPPGLCGPPPPPPPSPTRRPSRRRRRTPSGGSLSSPLLHHPSRRETVR